MRWWRRRRGTDEEQSSSPWWPASSIPSRRGQDPPPRPRPEPVENTSDDTSEDEDAAVEYWEGEYYDRDEQAPLSSDDIRAVSKPLRGPQRPSSTPGWGEDPPGFRREGQD